MVTEALIQCPNSNSSPDGISFKLLKAVSDLIISPLNTIFQHSLFEGIFPSVWKEATVIPLFKGKASRGDPSSYQPISLCQCIGKILELIVHTQLIKYIDDNQLLCSRQHGFVSGRSTLTNFLDSEAKICDIINSRHPYDILSFDFAKAFDKAPHHYVIEAATSFGICGKALEWLSSFLTCRTFRMRVGDVLSVSVNVTSGVIQGSTFGPVLYDIFIDSLLRKITFPSQAFDDDFKFIADVITHSKDIIQNEINIVADWADEKGTPLSKEKCCVLHCGPVQPYNVYHIKSTIIKATDTIIDLGIKRSCDGSYSEQCNNMILKATRTCGIIRHIFPLGHRNLLWPTF